MLKTAMFMVFTLLVLVGSLPAQAESEAVVPVAYVFGDNACTLCRTEVKWLFDEGIEYQYLNIDTNDEAKTWYTELLAKHDLPPITPLTIIGETVIVGYEKEQTTGHAITRAISKAKKNDVRTIAEHLAHAPKVEVAAASPCESLDCDTTDSQRITPIPFLGLVDLQNTTLIYVALILGLLTIPRLVSVGWLGVTTGAMILAPQRLSALCIGLAAVFVEVACYFYFFNDNYHTISRFVIETSYADVLQKKYNLLFQELHTFMFSITAVIDNLVAIAVILSAFPYIQRFDDERPGSVGIISATLVFIGGVCITYFILFP